MFNVLKSVNRVKTLQKQVDDLSKKNVRDAVQLFYKKGITLRPIDDLLEFGFKFKYIDKYSCKVIPPPNTRYEIDPQYNTSINIYVNEGLVGSLVYCNYNYQLVCYFSDLEEIEAIKDSVGKGWEILPKNHPESEYYK